MPDPYIAAFAARCRAESSDDRQQVDDAGILGLLAGAGRARSELLIVSDRALAVLATVLPGMRSGTIRIYGSAPECTDLLTSDARWRASTATAMTSADLTHVPQPPLPDGLALLPVSGLTEPSSGSATLSGAVAAAMRASADSTEPADRLAVYLRSLLPDAHIFAAVDHDGVVRGTSASRTFGSEAYVFFVNTDPSWRRRGVALSMTATALSAAAADGAARATLDASGVGVPLYQRLGFAALGPMMRFNCP